MAAAKLAYLDGVVELMTTSREHEGVKSWIGRLVEARLAIPEVWFWIDDAISVHVLGAHGYAEARSQFLPDLDLEQLCRFLTVQPASEAIKQYLASLRTP